MITGSTIWRFWAGLRAMPPACFWIDWDGLIPPGDLKNQNFFLQSSSCSFDHVHVLRILDLAAFVVVDRSFFPIP